MRCVTLCQCFLVDALLAATGSGGAFILKGHVTSCQQCFWFFFPLAEVSLLRSRLPLAQFSTVLHFLDHDNIV